jgi:hypothetical protein
MTNQRCDCEADIRRHCQYSTPEKQCECKCHDPKPPKKSSKKSHKCLRCGAGPEWIE